MRKVRWLFKVMQQQLSGRAEAKAQISDYWVEPGLAVPVLVPWSMVVSEGSLPG